MFGYSKHKKIAVSVFIGLFVFVELFGLLFAAGSARAQGGPVSAVIVTRDAPAETKEVKMGILAVLTDVALGSLLHAATYFMRRLAYDTAMYLATGGNGQGALIFEGKAGDYFTKLRNDATADMIDQLGKPFGLNLCQNANLDFQVFLKIGLRSLYIDYWGGTDGPKPSCDWASLKLKDNWETYTLQKGFSPERAFTNALRFEDSDFGLAVGAMSKIGRNESAVEKGAQVDRMEGQGFKAVTELVTGQVKTPAQMVKSESELVSNKGQSEMTMGQVAGIYGVSSLKLIPMAASVFLNTFMSQGLKTLQEKLLTLGQGGGGGEEDLAGLLSFESSGFQSSRQKAQAVFSSILSVSIQQMNDYPILEELVACPDPPLKPGLNNCAMDMGLRNALELARQGTPLTIREAMDRDDQLLKGGLPLISPRRLADNTSKDCYLKGYCYSNLQKLRRSRILPLGFEIAAYFADPDTPEKTWTLRQVVDGFDDCKDDNNDGIIEPDFVGHPYCHLIDPNWVLKVPDTRCNAKVYSSNLADENSGIRSEECVDAPARLKIRLMPGTSKEDNYGYCTREKNVWNLPGDSCDAHYNTCTTFTASKDGKMSSYLARTVDYGECNLSNKGCLAYSTEQRDGQWITSVEAKGFDFKKFGRNQTIYFNDKIKLSSCSTNDNGCSEFYLGSFVGGMYVNDKLGGFAYLKKAPDYLGCYDAKPGLASPGIDWPQTKPELKDIKPDEEKCSKFAGVCLPEEVNCDSYTPIKEPNPISIPAVVGEKNFCDESCVGYDTFKQTKTNFASAEFPLYFIPTQGESCVSVGCDEFTNIDIQTKGGKGEELEQYTDLKYCERPNGQNESVFYSWEGSETEGYVLKTHKLRPLTESEHNYLADLQTNSKFTFNYQLINIDVDKNFPKGSPAYASDDGEYVGTDYFYCNEDGYKSLINGNEAGENGVASIDCRALYDKNGKIFYRLLKDTITVAESCHPLRKTISYLYTDDNIKDEKFCKEEKKGYWGDDPTDDQNNTPVCRRCYNGGFYENGACIYWAISQPGEAESCLASDVGCREYRGNAGNNLEFVWQEDFVPGEGNDTLSPIAKGWTASSGQLAIVSEAIQVNGYSLQVMNAGKAIYTFSSSTLSNGELYTLSFWTRGAPQKLSVYFKQGSKIDVFTFDKAHNQNTDVSVSSEWQEFKFGPVQFTGESYKPAELIFERKSGTDSYYLDNTRLLRVNDVYPLIKDSWKKENNGHDVPAVCYDGTPQGIPTDPYPGAALGCKKYHEKSTDSDRPIIGFEKMCREDAVGCRAMFDTYNTDEVGMTVYNAWCEPGKGGTIKNGKCLLVVNINDKDETLGECPIEPGAKGCFVDKIILFDEKFLLNNDEWVKASTVVVPADTPSTAPIYLTNRLELQCQVKDVGCQEFGPETQVLPNTASSSFKFSDSVMLLNDPAYYVKNSENDGTLCRDDLVGCGEFKADNNLFYFKNPEETGNSFCEYKPPTTIGNVSYFGWFKKDIGRCSNDNTKLCRENDDCGKDNFCDVIGSVPCYEDYLLQGGEYGIWSNNTFGKYKSMVGLCPDQQNGCREFVDPADTSDLNPDGKPYYAIYNDKLKEKENICEGNVSLKEGCVLFNKTDEPNLTFDTVETYKNSENHDPKYGFVPPVSNNKNDANHILKVDRDRECAEWLACRGSIPIPYPQAENGTRYSCYALQACDDGNTLKCTHELAPEDIEGRLDYYKYIQRDVSWSGGREYTGYSLFNQYSPALLEFINIKKADLTDAKADKTLLAFVDRENTKCVSEKIDEKNGQTCGGFGICYQNQCISPVDAQFPGKIKKASEAVKYLLDSECRGFPEIDSPFPEKYVVDKWVHNKPFIVNPLYENAKVCQPDEDCSCNYLKEEFGQYGYSSEKRYYGLGSQNPDIIKGGICQGGAIDGEACVNDNDCGVEKGGTATGACLRQTSISQRIGWNGYCLERDLSRHINARGDEEKSAYACSTWLPLDYVPSLFDIYYSDPAVGYVPPQGAGNPGQLYCTEMLGNSGVGIKDDTPDDGDDTQACVQNIPFDKINYCAYYLNNKIDDPSYQTGLLQAFKSATKDKILEKGFVSGGFNYGKIYYKLDVGTEESNPDGSINWIYSPQTWMDLFGLAQTKTWELLDNLNPIHGLGTKENEYAYHYISRIDVGTGPGGGGFEDIASGSGGEDFFVEDSPLDKQRIEWSQLAGAFMTGEGPGEEYAIPLFPDIESPDAEDYKNTWDLNQHTGEGDSASARESPTSKNADAGIRRHKSNRAESFLEKSMIYAVSLIIIAPSELGGDTAEASDVPAFGYPLTIYLDKEYPSEGETIDSSALEMKKSGVGTCPFCKYWVMKTKNTREGYTEEGYLLQWHKTDPVSGNGEDAATIEAYANLDSYLVNPLRSTKDPDTASVKCIGSATGNHFIAMEIRFDKDTGEFLGYRSRNCNQLKDQDEFGYATAVVFTLRPMCVEAVSVYDSAQQTTNKAYTQNIWAEAGYVDNYGAASLKLDYNSSASPFGSARFGAGALTDKILNPWFRIYPDPREDEMHAGMPRTCVRNFSADGINYQGHCSQAGNFKDEQLGYQTANIDSDILSNRYKLFDNLFVKAFNVYSRVNYNSGGVYVLKNIWATSTPASSDLFKSTFYLTTGDKSFTNGRPPRIYPVKKCEGNFCAVDAKNTNNFSINGVGGTASSDKLYGKRSMPVTMSFFTWADSNQMPLRRVLVKWNDMTNTEAGKISGYYKNFKPSCDGETDKECISIADKTPTYDVLPVTGWVGKAAEEWPDEETGEVWCEDSLDCKDKFDYMYQQNYKTDPDLPFGTLVSCKESKCQKVTQIPEESVTVEAIYENYISDGWKELKSGVGFGTCKILYDKFLKNFYDKQLTYWDVNSMQDKEFERYTSIRAGEKVFNKSEVDGISFVPDYIHGKCDYKIEAHNEFTPIKGWIKDAGDRDLDMSKGEGPVSCGVLIPNDCKNKFDKMIELSSCSTDDEGGCDYPPSTDQIVCVNQICSTKTPVGVEYTQNDLFGLTCKDTDECPVNHICQSVNKQFGNQSQTTCVNTPALRVFNYTCDANKYVNSSNKPDYVWKVADIKTYPGVNGNSWYQLLLKKGHKDTELVCVFQPKVQVLDNWGWCTGACTGVAGADGRPGCYSDGLPNKCDPTVEDAWIKYDNIIVVAP